jgi:hypothetical protein
MSREAYDRDNPNTVDENLGKLIDRFSYPVPFIGMGVKAYPHQYGKTLLAIDAAEDTHRLLLQERKESAEILGVAALFSTNLVVGTFKPELADAAAARMEEILAVCNADNLPVAVLGKASCFA